MKVYTFLTFEITEIKKRQKIIYKAFIVSNAIWQEEKQKRSFQCRKTMT